METSRRCSTAARGRLARCVPAELSCPAARSNAAAAGDPNESSHALRVLHGSGSPGHGRDNTLRHVHAVLTHRTLCVLRDYTDVQALRRNPHAPVVPCHRVVAATLELGGFSGSWVCPSPLTCDCGT